MRYLDEQLLVRIKGLRLVTWRRHRTLKGGPSVRHSLTSLLWEPDVAVISPHNSLEVTLYVDKMVNLIKPRFSSRTLAAVATLLGLFCHKLPGKLDILHLDMTMNNSDITQFQKILNTDSSLRLARSYCPKLFQNPHCPKSATVVDRVRKTIKAIANSAKFHFIIAPSSGIEDEQIIECLVQLLTPRGSIVFPSEQHKNGVDLARHGLMIIYVLNPSATSSLVIASKVRPKVLCGAKATQTYLVCSVYLAMRANPAISDTILQISRSNSDQAQHTIETHIIKEFSMLLGVQIEEATLDKISDCALASGCLVFCTLEMVDGMLTDVTNVELKGLQKIMESASSLMWIQAADHINGGNLDMALVRGVARSLAVEQPSLKLFVLDIGGEPYEQNWQSIMSNLRYIVNQAIHGPSDDVNEREYVHLDGILYIGRFRSLEPLNEQLHTKSRNSTIRARLADVSRSQLCIQEIRQIETLSLAPKADTRSSLDLDCVEIQAQAYSINAKVRSDSI